jgi:hypothetical protein
MKLSHLTIATAAAALLGGAALAQQPDPAAPATGAVTGDQTGAQPPADTTAPPPVNSTTPPADTAAPPADTSAPPADTAVTPPPSDTATAAASTATNASFTNLTVTNGPVPDTAENRKKYGQPLSHAGKRSAAKGN